MSCSRAGISSNVNEFTFDVYNHIASTQPAENAFMSVSSLMIVMTMLHVGTKGNTEKQMADVLKLDNIERETLFCDMGRFIENLKEGSNEVQLKTANKIFPHSKNLIFDNYIKTIRNYFRAEVQSMNFDKFDESRKYINKWVAQETNGMIKDLLPHGSLTPLTAMVVANAIYFKGSWDGPFDPKVTRKGDFYINDKKNVQVDMMEKEFKNEDFGYFKSEVLNCKAIELTYTGGDIGMIIVLPNEKDGLVSMEKRITPAVLKQLVKKLHPRSRSLIVRIPKFKLEASYDMKQVLSSLGMTDLFDENRADLSGMGEDLYVSDIFHKAFVDVNEEGTEAAAATGGVILLGDDPIPRFEADHPFFFTIWDHRLHVPLFIGRLTNPVA